MVLDVSADNATDGARIVDTVVQCARDFNNPSDWAFDGVALGLDVLGFVANPLGTLVGAGIGWLIEHISFLKEPLDDLAGDPAAVNSVAAVWGETVGKACGEVGQEYARIATEQTSTWKGEAADGYRRAAAQVAEQVSAFEEAATAVATGVRSSGVLVASVRGIIRDLIADVVAEIIIAAAAALASSWFTFGASIAAFTGWAVARAAATAGKIAGKISKLLMKLSQAIRKFQKLRGASDALAKASVQIGQRAKSVGRAAGRNHGPMRQVEGTVDGWNDGLRNAVTFGNRTVTDAAERADELLSPRGRDGFADTVKPWSLARTGGAEAFKEGANWDESYESAAQENARQN